MDGGQEPGDTIKTMRLYRNITRIYAELQELGYDKADNLRVEDLGEIDQLHYYGTEALDEAIKTLHLKRHHHLLDIGSGVGGPARYLSHHTGCRVTGVEIQEDLNQLARDLTSKCGLSDKITYVEGDIITVDLGEHQFDVAIAFLTFLHIKDKRKLFSTIYKLLRPKTGRLYAEVLYAKAGLTPEEKHDLETDLYCGEDLPSSGEYIALMEEQGFKEVRIEALDIRWGLFVEERLKAYRARRFQQIEIHGEEVYKDLLRFYSVVNQLFSSGHLGGGRLIGHV